MPRPIPDHIQRIIDSVEASMTDDQIEQLADGDTRLLTSLQGQRARLQDPNLDRYCRAWDEWFATFQQYRQTGDEEIWLDQERAHWRLLQALRKIEVRGRKP
jgi:hypothetical protein